jgi:hypothetical protein
MSSQRSTMVNRIRSDVTMHLWGAKSTTPKARKEFRNLIGYDGKRYKWNAPILYPEDEVEHNLSNMFTNPKLMKVRS